MVIGAGPDGEGDPGRKGSAPASQRAFAIEVDAERTHIAEDGYVMAFINSRNVPHVNSLSV